MDQKERLVNIELLRVLACLGVICVHVLMDYRVEDKKLNGFMILLETLGRSWFPNFFIITGYFMFQRQKSIKLQYRNFLLRIFLPALLSIILLACFEDFMIGSKSCWECLCNLSLDAVYRVGYVITAMDPYALVAGFPLWYVFEMVHIYLWYPILILLCVDQSRENHIRHFIEFLSLIVVFIIPTISLFIPRAQELFGMESPIMKYSVVYILIGYEFWLLSQKQIKISGWLGALFFGTGLIFIMFGYYHMNPGIVNEMNVKFGENQNMSMLLMSVGIFIMISNLKIENRCLSGIIRWIGKRTYVIYLIHYPLIYYLQTRGLQSCVYNHLGDHFMILYCFGVFCIALLISFILHEGYIWIYDKTKIILRRIKI